MSDSDTPDADADGDTDAEQETETVGYFDPETKTIVIQTDEEGENGGEHDE
jgi:hypothetical protein